MLINIVFKSHQTPKWLVSRRVRNCATCLPNTSTTFCWYTSCLLWYSKISAFDLFCAVLYATVPQGIFCYCKWQGRVWAWGLHPKDVAPTPTAKQTGQESGCRLIPQFRILIVSVVKICEQCMQTVSASGALYPQTPYGCSPGPVCYSPSNDSSWHCDWLLCRCVVINIYAMLSAGVCISARPVSGGGVEFPRE